MNFSLRNIIVGIVVLTLAVAIPVTVRLAQEQQKLKSEAGTQNSFGFSHNGSSNPPGTIITITYSSVNVAGVKFYWLTQALGTCSDSVSCFNKTCSTGSCLGWNFMVATDTPDGTINWLPPVPADIDPSLPVTVLMTQDINPANFLYASNLSFAAPTGPQPVTVSGTVRNKVTSQGVQVTINQDAASGCNIGTKTTNASTGNYSFNNVTPTANTFCLRLPGIAGFRGVETRTGGSSYESLPSNSSSNRSDYDFFLIPDDNAQPTSFQILNASNTNVTTGPIFTSQPYTFSIRIRNSGNSIWKKGVYKLKPQGETGNIWSLAQSYDWISPSGDVASGAEAVFSVPGTAPASPSVGGATTPIEMVMNNSQQDFGSGIQRLIQVLQGSGGPGDGGTCSGSAGVIAGANRVWRCVQEDDQGSPPVGCVTGSAELSRACSGTNVCYPCLAETGITQRPTITSFSANPTPVNSGEDITLTWSVTTGNAAATSCTASGVSGWSGSKSVSGGSEEVSAPSVSAQTTKVYTLRCDNTIGSDTKTASVVVRPATIFDFNVSTSTQDTILVKGQSSDSRPVTVTKVGAGVALPVTLTVDDINSSGATPSFGTSSTCTPNSPDKCTASLTFSAADTSNIVPRTYPMKVRGISGSISHESNQFNLIINPAAAIVTCFVVSENRNTRGLFTNCAQSTIDNINNDVSKGVAGFLDITSTADFQLSANNVNKTLYARFLKLAQGESITACTDSTKCKDTTAGITLSIPPASPSPSSSPTSSPSPTASPSPSPTVQPLSCTKFELSGLTKLAIINSEGGPIYQAPSAGSNNPFDMVFTPNDATPIITPSSQTPGAPQLTITESNTTPVVRVANIPSNTSNVDNIYLIRAKILQGSARVDCLTMQVNVLKGTGGPPPPPPPSVTDRASCSTSILNRDSLQVITPPISSGQRLIFRVNMTNGGDTIWGKDTYKLKASADTSQQWGLSKDTFKITDPESKNKNDIRRNQSVVFDIPAMAAAVSAPSSQVFKFNMVNALDEEFSDACISQDTLVNPAPPPPPPPVGTACFFMDDKPISKTSCFDEGAQDYGSHPMVVPQTLIGSGRKTIFVRFISNLGAQRDFQRVINFKPDPKITEADCTHSPSGTGSIITITGTALGAQGRGKVKVGGSDAEIITWNQTTGVVSASLDKRIEGKNDIELTRDDGKTARGECSIGITSVVFAAQTQCRTGGNFATDNVSVKIFANVPAAIDAEKSEPVIDQKVRLDKDGKPAGFTPKLEKNKKYSLIVKAPATLAKRVDFETKGGSRNLDTLILPVGDIAPSLSADGKINAFDKSELIRQWSLITDVVRSGDLNGDSRVNSIDYACMRQNINKSDEEFSPSAPKESPSPTVSPTATPSATPTFTPVPTASASASPTASPSPSPSSPPAGGTGGTLFRVSFNPVFPVDQTIEGNLSEITDEAIINLTLPSSGQNSVYVQFFENGTWGPVPPQIASINLI